MENLTSANDKSFDIKEKTNLQRKLEDRSLRLSMQNKTSKDVDIAEIRKTAKILKGIVKSIRTVENAVLGDQIR